MAFNPFTSFRKHQKAWFAGLTIMCMLTFVLCTGVGGDAASALMRLFGGGGGETVARLDGDKVTTLQLSNLRVQRKVANIFMVRATRVVRNREFARAYKGLSREVKEQVGFALRQKPELMQRTLINLEGQLTRSQKSGQARLVRTLRLLASDEARRVKDERGDFYFARRDNDEALLQFLLWRREADRLDIQLTDQGVRQEVDRAIRQSLAQGEKGGDFEVDDRTWQAIEDDIRKEKYNEATPDYIAAALRDEFRVRLAQTAYLGYRPGLHTRPRIALTPEQFWQFYKDRRAEMEVEFLPIPALAFEDQVRGQPTQGELQALFRRGKTRAPDPALPGPAFKRPRQVAVAWVSADPESPFYQDLATRRSGVTPVNLKKPGAAVAALLGQTMGAAARQGTVLGAALGYAPTAWQVRLLRDYEVSKFEYRLPPATEELKLDNMSFYPLPAQKDTVNRPAPAVVALAGQVLGAARGQGFPLMAPLAYAAATYVERCRERAPVYADFVLAGVSPLPSSPWLRAANLMASWEVAGRARYVPLEIVKDRLLARFKKTLAEEEARTNLAELRKQLDQFKPAEKPLEIRRQRVEAIVKKAVKQYGLTPGHSDGLRDRWNLGTDPYLEPLKKEYDLHKTQMEQWRDQMRRNPQFGQMNFPPVPDFYTLFFDNTELFVPRTLATGGLFGSSSKPVLYWKTAQESERVPKTLQEVRAEVVKAWRLEKARALARRAAQQLAAELRAEAKKLAAGLKDAASDNERKRLLNAYRDRLKGLLAGPEERYGLKVIVLNDVAPLHIKDPTNPLQPQYERFPIPPNLFEYPRTQQWVRKILAMRQPEQEVQILENQPENVFYVGVRVTPPKAKLQDFSATYKRPGDALWDLCLKKYARDFQAKLIEQLKARAKFKDIRSRKEQEKDRIDAQEEASEDTSLPVE
jgi:hypothetical protein